MIGLRDCSKPVEHAVFVKIIFLAASKENCLYWALRWVVQFNFYLGSSISNSQCAELLEEIMTCHELQDSALLLLFSKCRQGTVCFCSPWVCRIDQPRVWWLLWVLWAWASFRHPPLAGITAWHAATIFQSWNGGPSDFLLQYSYFFKKIIDQSSILELIQWSRIFLQSQ